MAKLKAKKKCVKGFACGYTCIKRGRTCRKNASAEVSEVAENFAKATKSLTGGITEATLKNSKKLGKGYTADIYITPNNTLIKKANVTQGGDEVTLSKLAGDAGVTPKVLNTGKIEDGEYIEMEYLDGYKPIANVKLTPAIKADVVKSLEALHGLGIVHRDFHKYNVMVEPKTKNVKIIDLGLSKKADSASVKKSSPEEAALSRMYKEDLWSLQALLETLPESAAKDFLNNKIDVLTYLDKARRHNG